MMAVRMAGMLPVLFRWNSDPRVLSDYDGYILPGGFSYQDRVRAGAVAAKKEIMVYLMEAAEQGKPILGICNGAQILVETGMIPGNAWGAVQMAIATNASPRSQQLKTGYQCDWLYLRTEPQNNKSAFSLVAKPGEIIPLPVAHAEGRFTSRDPALVQDLLENHQIGFRYCTSEGKISTEFPMNPNGSICSIAGLYNPGKNVLALMPHPERAIHLHHMPYDMVTQRKSINHSYHTDGSGDSIHGPGFGFFSSMRAFIEQRGTRNGI